MAEQGALILYIGICIHTCSRNSKILSRKQYAVIIQILKQDKQFIKILDIDRKLVTTIGQIRFHHYYHLSKKIFIKFIKSSKLLIIYFGLQKSWGKSYHLFSEHLCIICIKWYSNHMYKVINSDGPILILLIRNNHQYFFLWRSAKPNLDVH